MQRAVAACAIACLMSVSATGQEQAGSNYEHLKCYDQLIGAWEYEGPAPESAEGIVNEGDTIRIRITFAWIFNKNALESTFFGEVKKADGISVTGKSLIGWDTAKKGIIEGGLNSFGGHYLGMSVYDEKSKTLTTQNQSVDGEGKELFHKTVWTIKDKDTCTVQLLDRKGGPVEGDGPALMYKRVGSSADVK